MREYGKRDPSSHRTPAQIRQMDRTGYNHTHIKERELRNQARAYMKKKLGAKAIAGKDIDHRKKVVDGGTNAPSNLRVRSIHANRGDTR